MISLQMTSSEEDPHSKRGGHRLFDHSFFPDAAFIIVRGETFTISTSYLALHSPYFYDLFYGPDAEENKKTFELDFHPTIFGDLLDLIYPCFKKTSCCNDCSSSRADRLDVALKLKLRLAVKRLIEDSSFDGKLVDILRENNEWNNYSHLFNNKHNIKDKRRHSFDRLTVSDRFPDSALLIVNGTPITVSATSLSLHSPVLASVLYKNDQVVQGAAIDVDIHSFFTFLDMTSGNMPRYTDCSSEFLDDLVELGASHFYNFYVSEIRKKMMILPSDRASYYAAELLEHYSHYRVMEMDRMKSVALYLWKDELENVLSKCVSLRSHTKEMLKNYVESIKPFQVFYRNLKGRHVCLDLPEGSHTTVEDLKMRVRMREGVSADAAFYTFRGRSLNDGKTLGEVGMTKDSTFVLNLKLRGC